jgi:hypothetical protein
LVTRRRAQAVILNNFASRYKNRGIFDEKEITDSLPPQLKLKVAVAQYFTHVDRAPFFMGLGFGCLAMLCSTVEHLDVSKEQDRLQANTEAMLALMRQGQGPPAAGEGGGAGFGLG